MVKILLYFSVEICIFCILIVSGSWRLVGGGDGLLLFGMLMMCSFLMFSLVICRWL